MRVYLFAFALCYAIIIEPACTMVIRLLARREKAITRLTLNTEKSEITSSANIILDIDESFPVLIASDVGRSILAYMESWLRSSSGNIRLISLDANSSVPAYVHRSSGIVEETVTSLAFEWITGKLYIGVETASVQSAGRIEVCPLDGKFSCAIVLHSSLENSRVDALHSLVLDPGDGYMYWLNRVHKRIERAWMDGRHHDPYCFKDDTRDVIATTALTLDQAGRSLYYIRTRASPDDSQIWSCSLYNRESCRAVASKVNAFYLDVFSDYLVWTSVTNSGITVCEKVNCDSTAREVANSSGIEALIVYDERIQPTMELSNPCASNNGGCSHICVLIPGAPWRSCLCPVGVRLLQDRFTCSPNGIERLLYVATTSGLIFISLDTGHHTPMPLLNAGSEIHDTKIVHIDFDPIDKKLYMIDGDVGVIRRCNPDGAEMEIFVEDSVNLVSEAVAVDWLNRNLYWLDSNVVQIKMQSISNSGRQIVISHGLKQPRGLTLDPDGGYIFFSDWHESTSRIEKAWLDGSNRQIIVTLEKDAWPNGIAVDTRQKRLYWAEGSRSLIKSAALDGDLGVHIFSGNVNHPYSLTILGNTLYCNSLYGRKISAFRISQRNESFLGEKLSVISDSVIFGQMGIRAVSLNHVPKGTSPCQANNGGCSHICVKLPNGERSCICPVGYELQTDNATCVMPAAFLIYTQSPSLNSSSTIMRISLEATPANNHRINIASLAASPVSVAVDQSLGRIFWSSKESGRPVRSLLRSAFFNGSGLKTLHEGNTMNFIAVDWTTSNIYWCSTEQRRIEMVRGDGRSHHTVAWKNIDPRYLVIHSLQQFLMFVNYYNRDKVTINKMSLYGDPSGGRVIVRQLGTVNALAIDFDSELLVWSELDEKGGGIFVADFSGGSRARLLYSEKLLPTALTVYSRKIYIANAKSNTIDLYSGSSLKVLHSDISYVTNLAVAHAQIAEGWSGCVHNNSDCGGICVSTGEIVHNASTKCICEDHFTLDKNGKKCLPPKHFMLVAIRGRFMRFNLKQTASGDIRWKDDPYSILSVTGVGTPVSIGVDLFSANRSVYWIDSHDDKVIKRSSDIPRSMTHTVTLSRRSNCAVFFYLAVDEVGRQLFVSCAEHGLDHVSSIHVWRIKSNDELDYIGVVVSGRERSPVTDRPPYPQQIALFPRLNLLFYVDDGGPSPLIIRCSLDGRHCIQWETPNLTHAVKLRACQISDRLYYTTANGLWSRDAHVFSDVRHHVKARASDIDMVPVSEKKLIVIAKNEYQFDDLLLELMDDVPTVSLDELKWGTSSPFTVQSVLALAVVGSTEVDFYDNSNHTCAVSHCSHMCRVSRDSRKRYECLCPLGFGLQTPSGTSCFEHVSCLYWQFKCDDGQECIHAMAKCDGHRDCTDGSDESPRWCRNVAVDKWPCNDRKASVSRALICNGVEDCPDGSDETHCRCPNPVYQFDCTSGLAVISHPAECISRELMCDGISNCYAGQDEQKQLCAVVGTAATFAPALSPSFELMIPLAVFFLALSIIVSVCCCHFSMRRPLRQNFSSATVAHSLPVNAEARVLLPAHSDGTQVEFQLRTYSVGAASSLYNALPPPNSQISTDATSYHRSLNGNCVDRNAVFAAVSAAAANADSKNFFAPPPSAASLSTYGVVKPAGMRVHVRHGTALTRNRRKQRHRTRTGGTSTHSPPPSYSQVTTSSPVCVDLSMDCSEEESQQLRAPTNSRIVSSVDASSQEGARPIVLPCSRYISSPKSARQQQQRLLDYSSTSSDVSLG